MRDATRTHPELDELAAFVDGRLEGSDRERLTVHLASCSECRNLFAETARLVDELKDSWDEEPEPRAERRRVIPGPWPQRIAVAAAVAATLALAAISPRIFDLVQMREGASLEALAAGLVEAEPDGRLGEELARSWQSHEWPRPRSPGSPTSISNEERSFQLGVRAMELEIALRSRQAELAQRLTYRLASLLGDDPRLEQARRLYVSEQGVRGGLAAGADPQSLTTLTRSAADLLMDDAAFGGADGIDRRWLELGLWARAAQLAAETGSADYFEQRINRRRLGRLAEEPLPVQVAAPVDRLVILLADKPAAHLLEIESELTDLVTAAGGGAPP